MNILEIMRLIVRLWPLIERILGELDDQQREAVVNAVVKSVKK